MINPRAIIPKTNAATAIKDMHKQKQAKKIKKAISRQKKIILEAMVLLFFLREKIYFMTAAAYSN
jgi:hypothetical protein